MSDPEEKEITVKLLLDMSIPGAQERVNRLLERLYREEAAWEREMSEPAQAMFLDPVEFSLSTRIVEVDRVPQTGKSIHISQGEVVETITSEDL